MKWFWSFNPVYALYQNFRGMFDEEGGRMDCRR